MHLYILQHSFSNLEPILIPFVKNPKDINGFIFVFCIYINNKNTRFSVESFLGSFKSWNFSLE